MYNNLITFQTKLKNDCTIENRYLIKAMKIRRHFE